MRAALEAIHFYRRVPRDLSKGTPTGGVLSLFAAASMAYLFFSDLALFFQVRYTHEVRVDQFLSVDVFDVMGASVHNVSSGIHRERVFPSGNRSAYRPLRPQKSWHKGLGALMRRPGSSAARGSAAAGSFGAGADGGGLNLTALAPAERDQLLRRLSAANFTADLKAHEHLLVLFGASWCRWTRELIPVWAEAAAKVRALQPLADRVAVARVDCSRRDSEDLCRSSFVQAFPEVRLYSRDAPGTHRSYMGPRDADSILAFARLVLGSVRDRTAAPVYSNVVHGERGQEGCELTGAVFVARVPGNLRLAAHAPEHSFNPRWIDMDHVVTSFTYGVPEEDERARHERELVTIASRGQRLAEHERAMAMGADGTLSTGEGHFVHTEDLAFLPENSRGSTVHPFRPGKKHLAKLMDNVEALHIKRRRIHDLHARDAHGPNSLGNHSFVSSLPFVSIEHYIKVIPTTYLFADGDELDSYVYTVNNRETIRSYTPNVVFSYDFQALRVLVQEQHMHLAPFLTQVCAIIGGVFTVVGIVDALLHSAGDLITRKMQEGKLI